MTPLLVAAALATAPLDADRSRAKGILVQHCGTCHYPYFKTARAGALRVFNLGEEEWFASMTDRQLNEALLRLGQFGEVTADERARFGVWVGAELDSRHAARPASGR